MASYNLDQEKTFLSAAIRYPTVLATCNRINERDFSPTNRVVFSALKSCAAQPGFSKFILIDKLNSLGIKIADTIEPGLYVNSLEGLGVVENAAEGIARELKLTAIRRELNDVGKKIQRATEKDDGKKAMELVAEVTKIFNEHVNLIEGSKEHEPVALYGTIKNLLSRDNSISEKAIASPFPIFNDMFGYFDIGSVYLLCSRMKIGKSSFWLSMGEQLSTVATDDNLRVLVLDTELETWENHSRALAARSGVNEFRIRQGWYRKNKEETRKVEEAAEYLESFGDRVQHCFCGGMSLESIISTARRWAFKNLTEGKRGMIVYDYFKLNSADDFKSKNPLFIQMGAKMDAFKNLSKELKVPVFCFAQTNRENVDSKGGEKQQNSSVVGGSDMLAQFASNIYLLEELTPEELAALRQLGPDGATHSLREIACRQRGPCEMGENRLVKYKDGKGKDKYSKNYLLFQFKNFNVKEVGTFKRVVDANRVIDIKVQDDHHQHPPTTL